MADVNTSAEPSAAAPVQFDSWDDKGNPVVSKKETSQTQDSAPASAPETKVPPVSKDESAAESGAAPKQEKKGEKLNAEERVQQAVREKNEAREEADRRVKALEERIRTLESAPKPATEAKTEAQPVEPPKRPNPFKWTGTAEEYETAQEAWENHLRTQSAVEAERRHQWKQTQQKNQELLKEATAKYPDAEAKIRQATGELMKQDQRLDFVKVFVNDSEVLGDLLYALSDEKTLNNVLETAKTNPSKVLRVLRDMELDIQKAVKAPEAKAEPEQKASPDPDKPRAPKPPSEVGGRGTSMEDAQVAAARSGDFRAFEAEENRKKLARA